MKITLLSIILVFTFLINASAQDDLMNVLKETQTVEHEHVIATFKTLKIINAQTNETVHKRVLDFRIAHRFGNLATHGSFHNWFGMDDASDIRIAFEYGITDRLAIGLARSKFNENLEGLVKFRLLQQTKDNHVPVSITLFGSSTFTAKKDFAGQFQKVDENKKITKLPARRIKYATQAIIARQFSSKISVLLSPTYIHRNYVNDPKDDNDLFSLGIGARIKVTRSMCIIADYFYTFSDYRRNHADPEYYKSSSHANFIDPLGIGVEFETGGHVFSLMFTNSPAIIETEFLETHDTWSDGGIKFSFNISRNFSL